MRSILLVPQLFVAIIFPECALAETLATGHPHTHQLGVGHRRHRRQQDLLLLHHLHEIQADVLQSLATYQPFSVFANPTNTYIKNLQVDYRFPLPFRSVQHTPHG